MERKAGYVSWLKWHDITHTHKSWVCLSVGSKRRFFPRERSNYIACLVLKHHQAYVLNQILIRNMAMADTWETQHDLSFAIPPKNCLGSLFEINTVNLDLPKKKHLQVIQSDPFIPQLEVT